MNRPVLSLLEALLISGSAFPYAASALDYERDIMPIFEEKCFKCHSAKAEKLKGGLRLDDPGHFQKRFAKNDVVLPGNWDASYLFVTISRPHDDRDAMPPTDEGTPLTGEEILKVANWIYEGARINGEDGEKGSPDDKPEDFIKIEGDKMAHEQFATRSDDQPRKWTNREGKTIIAVLVGVEETNALLKLSDGKTFKYPIEKLSDDSQAELRKRTATSGIE